MGVIAITAALQGELAAVVEAARSEGPLVTRSIAGHTVHRGRLAGREVALALTGVGKVAAAATAAVLAQQAESVLMVGTAGGIGPGVHPGDVVIAAELLQHDMDARPLFDRWVVPSLGIARFAADRTLTGALAAAAEVVVGRRQGGTTRDPHWHLGLIVSGDSFVATPSDSLSLTTTLPDALAVEMESAAVAQVCHTAGIPFAVARTISDRADEDAAVDFPQFLAEVAGPYAAELVTAALPWCP